MLSLNLSKNLFWDVEFNSLDETRDKRLIIERAVSMGDLTDIKEILKFYGIEIIKQEIIEAGYLDNKTLAWLSVFLKIPKIKFKCYTKRQSNLIHWNF